MQIPPSPLAPPPPSPVKKNQATTSLPPVNIFLNFLFLFLVVCQFLFYFTPPSQILCYPQSIFLLKKKISFYATQPTPFPCNPINLYFLKKEFWVRSRSESNCRRSLGSCIVQVSGPKLIIGVDFSTRNYFFNEFFLVSS